MSKQENVKEDNGMIGAELVIILNINSCVGVDHPTNYTGS